MKKGHVEDIFKYHYDELLEPFAKCVQLDRQTVVRVLGGVRVLPHAEGDVPLVNAWTDHVDGTFRLSFASPLFVWLFDMALLWAMRTRGEDDEEIPFEKTVELARGLLDNYFGGGGFRIDVMPQGLAGPQRVSIAETLCFHAVRFMVAHELGHVAFRLDRPGTRSLVSKAQSSVRASVQWVMGKRPEWSRCRRQEELIRDWTQETFADYLGLRLCLGLAEPKGEVWERFAHYGARLVFAACDMQEGFQASQTPMELLDDHPWAKLRLFVLNQVVTDRALNEGHKTVMMVDDLVVHWEGMNDAIMRKLGIWGPRQAIVYDAFDSLNRDEVHRSNPGDAEVVFLTSRPGSEHE